MLLTSAMTWYLAVLSSPADPHAHASTQQGTDIVRLLLYPRAYMRLDASIHGAPSSGMIVMSCALSSMRA